MNCAWVPSKCARSDYVRHATRGLGITATAQLPLHDFDRASKLFGSHVIELLDDWEDRYRFVIELGKLLPDLSEATADMVAGATRRISRPGSSARSQSEAQPMGTMTKRMTEIADPVAMSVCLDKRLTFRATVLG